MSNPEQQVVFYGHGDINGVRYGDAVRLLQFLDESGVGIRDVVWTEPDRRANVETLATKLQPGDTVFSYMGDGGNNEALNAVVKAGVEDVSLVLGAGGTRNDGPRSVHDWTSETSGADVLRVLRSTREESLGVLSLNFTKGGESREEFAITQVALGAVAVVAGRYSTPEHREAVAKRGSPKIPDFKAQLDVALHHERFRYREAGQPVDSHTIWMVAAERVGDLKFKTDVHTSGVVAIEVEDHLLRAFMLQGARGMTLGLGSDNPDKESQDRTVTVMRGTLAMYDGEVEPIEEKSGAGGSPEVVVDMRYREDMVNVRMAQAAA